MNLSLGGKKYAGIVVDRRILHSYVEAITRAPRYRSSVAFTRRKLSTKEKCLRTNRGRRNEGKRRKKKDHFSTTIENTRQRIVSRTPRLLFPFPLRCLSYRFSLSFAHNCASSWKNFISDFKTPQFVSFRVSIWNHDISLSRWKFFISCEFSATDDGVQLFGQKLDKCL